MAGIARRPESRQRWMPVGAALAAAVLFGAARAEGLGSFLAFLLVVLAALLPAVLWLRRGGRGIPVLPAFALVHVVNFGVPIVMGREDFFEYSTEDLFAAAATVALFLVTACAVAEWVIGKPGRRSEAELSPISARQMRSFIFIGLGVGLLYHLSIAVGVLWQFGAAVGLVRSVSLTVVAAACYFLGVARAQGVLKGTAWVAGLGGLALVAMFSISSLFLVGGATFALAAILGYVITRRRIPWLALVSIVVLISVLHAGKEPMRRKYWDQDNNMGGGTAVSQVPGLMVEWVGVGLDELAAGTKGRSAFERASLIQILLRAQRLTPDHIDFMHGETYALLPGMLVPRFLSPRKIASQAGMDMLNIRYGFLSVEGAAKTAIAWGLIAEAWANFGYAGQIAIGLIVGLLCGSLTRWSSGAPAVSRASLLSVTTMLSLINASDMASFVTSLWQSTVAVLIAFWLFQLVASQQRRAMALRRLTSPQLDAVREKRF